jgi:CHASE2 domain-containing sensor protein
MHYSFDTWFKMGIVLIISLVVVLLVDLPHGPEHWSSDLRTSLLSKRASTQNRDIALVEINNAALRRMAYTLPIDRELLARIIEAIDAAGPKAIGIDIILDRPTEPRKDELLVSAIKNAKSKIVLGVLDRETMLSDAREYQDGIVQQTGRPVGHLYLDTEHSNRATISDYVVREIVAPVGGQQPVRGLAEELAAASGKASYPADPHIAWLLPPKDGTDVFLTLPAASILDREGPPVGELLRNRIVLIGGNFPDRDQHLTPLSVSDGSRSSGLFIHAQILRQMLDGQSFRSPGRTAHAVLLAAAVFVGWFFGTRLHGAVHHVVFELFVAVLLLSIGVGLYAFFDTLFPFLTIWLAIVTVASIMEVAREKEQHHVSSAPG